MEPGWWVALAVSAGAAGTLLTARRVLVAVTVLGASMLPTYRPGDRVLVLRTARAARGRVVVARPPASFADPRSGFVIKRIAALPGDPVPPAVRGAVTGTVVPAGSVVLLGDNPAGADSREWGLVDLDQVLGVVVARLEAG